MIINDQISREMDASLFYYALQLKFSSQSLNRPNFAKMLGERAAEEREHAHMLAEFQQSRGYDVKLKSIEQPKVWEYKTIDRAFDAMIKKETELTKGDLFVSNLKSNLTQFRFDGHACLRQRGRQEKRHV